MKSKWVWPSPPAFGRFKVLITMISLQNIIILGVQCLLMLLRSKLVKDNQAIKHTHVCELNIHCTTPSLENFNSKSFQATVVAIHKQITLKQIDILISKNQALQILFLFQCMGKIKEAR